MSGHEDIVRAASQQGAFDALNGYGKNPGRFSGDAFYVYENSFNSVARERRQPPLPGSRAPGIPTLPEFLGRRSL
jgi:hypothetical protein